MSRARLTLMLAALASLAGLIALVEVRIAARADGNGVLLSRYPGVYGNVGGALFQVVTVEGWPIVHVVGPEGEHCTVLTSCAPGLLDRARLLWLAVAG